LLIRPAINYDVVILGAGAAGLLCAATAARRGRRVLVLEKANKVGKKILMSGGGRCNFTNYVVESDNFISDNPHFCKAALSRYTQWDFVAMVERHGIAYEERKHSQLFCKHSARDIVAMLLDECRAAGVVIKTHCDVGAITSLSGDSAPDSKAERRQDTQLQHCANYRIELAESRASDTQESTGPMYLVCHSLVIATGALSVPTLGGSSVGYDIAQQFGLVVTQRRAGLVPFMFTSSLKLMCERLAGVAVEVAVRCNGQAFTENLLFTHRGISGPAILQISSYWKPGDEIFVDLLPGIDAGEWLVDAKHRQGKNMLKALFAQKLPKALVGELQTLWWAELSDAPLAELSDGKLQLIGEQFNHWRLKPSATEGYRTAEVTLGGVDTSAISSKTMEVKHQPGLYFIGEVLDVTGQLGGFNFQWAWSSGYSAGLVV